MPANSQPAKSSSTEFVPCHDCGKETTVTRVVLRKHQGDYVLCPSCTSRKTEDPGP